MCVFLVCGITLAQGIGPHVLLPCQQGIRLGRKVLEVRALSITSARLLLGFDWAAHSSGGPFAAHASLTRNDHEHIDTSRRIQHLLHGKVPS